MFASKGDRTNGWFRVFGILMASILVPACGSSGGGGGNPLSGAPPLPAGVTQLQSGYVLSTFAVGPAGSTKPDSILQVGNSVYVAYQDQLDSKGFNPGGVPPGQGNNEVVQYDLSGNFIRSITITGHNDGMVQIDSNTLWVMSNEDLGPYLNVITLSTGAVTKVTPTAPPAHGGGYDDMIMIDGIVYVSCSNPSNPGTHVPLVVKIAINPGTATFTETPLIYSDAGKAATDSVTDVTTGLAIGNLKFTDPDSMALTPNADLMVDGQADSALAFIHSPNVPNQAAPAETHQFINVLPLTLGGNPWPIDDTRFASPSAMFMLVTDTGANTIYRVDPPATGWLTGSVSTTPGGAFKGTAYSAGNGGIYTLDLLTGSLYPIFTGLKTPHGLRFINPPPSLLSTVTSVNPNYSVSLFAQAPAGSSKPDSVVQVGGPGGNVFIGYQGQLNHDGTIPPNPPAPPATPQGFVSVVQYDLTGKVVKTYPIKGHIDGMLEIVPPSAVDTSNLWVMSNEDATPVLTTINTVTGMIMGEYQPAAAPAHGGGYDDMSLIGGKVYVSCSNPSTPGTGPIVGLLTIAKAPNLFTVASVVPAGVAMYDPVAGAISGKFAFTDPDSTEVSPTGDLLVDGQADGALATIPAAQLTSGPPPLTAATLALGATAMNTTNGTHSGYVTFVSALGESLAGPASNQITITTNQAISWTGVPTGPAGTTSRNLYITIAGDTGLPLLVGTIAGNVLTTFTSTKADASLGAAAPVVKVLNVLLFGNPLPADDTRFVPAVAPQFLLVTDPSSNQTYRINSTAAWTAGTSFNAGAISVNSLDMTTGISTPIVTGGKAPHGMLFVK